MSGHPHAALLSGGRLHLHHGPIDLIIGADPVEMRAAGFAAARRRFDGMLAALVEELTFLRTRLTPDSARPEGAVARRMHAAARPHCADVFVTPMAGVAGAVADEVLAAMTAAAPLTRAYVNNGGDIALHLSPGTTFGIAMAGPDRADLGRVRIGPGEGIGGLATSGTGGRSLSLGIADSVTVLAECAAAADVAATLIANATDLPGHPSLRRAPAESLDPDSDLGARAVVTGVGPLTPAEVRAALDAGARTARAMQRAGQVSGAALFLRGASTTIGDPIAIEKSTIGKVA